VSRPNSVTKHLHPTGRSGKNRAAAHPDLVVSKRRLRKVGSVECVRPNREGSRQTSTSHPGSLSLCGLPTEKAGFWCLPHERRNGLIENGPAGHRRSRHLRYCSERALSIGEPAIRLNCLCEDRTRSRRMTKRQAIRIKPMVAQETTSRGRFDQVMNGEGALEPTSYCKY
jgi:hypothetical protein